MEPFNLSLWYLFLSSMESYSTLLLILLAVFNLIFLILILVERRANKKFRTKYLQLLEGLHTENLEDLVLEHRRQVVEALTRLESLEKALNSLKENFALTIQKMGMVRYNAFPGLGSDQSFSVALLDGRDNGVVFTSIHGRDDSRFFAKPIQKGKSRYRLTDEELLALDRARKDSEMGGLLSSGGEEDPL